MKVGLFLMGRKGLSCLKGLLENNSDIRCTIEYIICSKDSAVYEDCFDDIKEIALKNSIKFLGKSESILNIEVDVMFAISWRWKINLNIDKLIVFHDSILPKYRGFNPLVTALIEGDHKIGVTAIRANNDFDTGNIIGCKQIHVNYPLKISAAISLVSSLYRELLIEILWQIKVNKIVEVTQDHKIATYSLWRDNDDYFINWEHDASRIKRFIDAVGFPYNGAVTNYDSQKIIIKDSLVIEDLNIVNRSPGKILFLDENKPTVVCGTGLIRIENAILFENSEQVVFNKLRVKLK